MNSNNTLRTLTWLHTRKNTPMKVKGTFAQVMVRIWMVRHASPGHVMQLDGKTI